MIPHLEQILQNYGLSEKEAKIYLSILEIGSANASTIARRSGVNRATVYPIIEELKKRNIAIETEKNNVKQYSVIDPNKLFEIYEEKYTSFKNALPEFLSLADRRQNTPKIQFFDGYDKVDKMLYDYSDTWIKSMAQYDQTRWGYQDHGFVEHYLPWLEWYRKKNVPGEKICLISNASEIEKKIGKEKEKSNNRFIKTLPEGFNFTSTIWVCGDYIIMIMTQSNKHYAFQIHDKVFASNLKEVFKLLWFQFSKNM